MPSHFPTAEAGVLYSPRNYDGRYRVTSVSASLATPFKLGDVGLRYQGQWKAQKAAAVVPPTVLFCA